MNKSQSSDLLQKVNLQSKRVSVQSKNKSNLKKDFDFMIDSDIDSDLDETPLKGKLII